MPNDNHADQTLSISVRRMQTYVQEIIETFRMRLAQNTGEHRSPVQAAEDAVNAMQDLTTINRFLMHCMPPEARREHENQVMAKASESINEAIEAIEQTLKAWQ